MKFLFHAIFLMLVSSCSTVVVQDDLFLGSRDLASTGSCTDLVKKIINRSSGNVLDRIKKKMIRSNYFIRNNEIFYKRQIEGKSVEESLGKLEIIEPRYLFEWQDKKSHEAWMAQGGIVKEEMDLILASEEQTYGRGYYVSLDIYDSQGYGTHLTVFEVKEPMVVLHEGYNKIKNNELILNELRSFGVAGIKGTKTWLNIINEKYLLKVTKMNDELIRDISESSSSKVPYFEILDLLKVPSLRSVINTPEISDLILKIETNKTLSSFERRYLVGKFKLDPKGFLVKNTDPKIIKFIFAEMGINELQPFIDSINYAATKKASKMITELEKIFNKIPQAEAFFSLFDLYDIALIGKKIGEPLSYKNMLKFSQKYEANLKQVDLSTIKKPEEFTKAASEIFGIKYGPRSSDVQMMTHSKNYDLELSSQSRVLVKDNRLLSVEDVMDNGKSGHVEVVYFSIEHIHKVRRLFTDDEYNQITNMKDTEAATRMSVDLLLKHFFNPKKFDVLVDVVFPNEEVNPRMLYKAFISLHPFSDGNGRAARLYYRWLVTNHFKKDSLNPHFLVNELDLFIHDRDMNDFTKNAWYISRLWVLAAKNEKDMIERSKQILLKEYFHRSSILNAPYLMEFLKNE